MQAGPDPTMGVVILPLAPATGKLDAPALMDAVLAFSDEGRVVEVGGELGVGKHLSTLQAAAGTSRFAVRIDEPGPYALFTEHHPDEFQARLRGPDTVVAPSWSHAYKPDHEHDEEVTSVGISTPGDLDGKRLQQWIGNLLQAKGTDIFRMKGVLSIKGEAERFVFQGVHMLFDGRSDRPWGDAPRRNALIFIGRNLDREELNEGFRQCLA
jgi:G3E family GTPase